MPDIIPPTLSTSRALIKTALSFIKPKIKASGINRRIKMDQQPAHSVEESNSLPKTRKVANRTVHPTDHQLLDKSKVPLHNFISFLSGNNGKDWVESYCHALENLQPGESMPMPAMAEATTKMQRVLSESLALPGLSKDDHQSLIKFMATLEANANNGYPHIQSEVLALCFATLRDYLFGKYATQQDCQSEGANKLREKLNACTQSVTAQQILDLPWENMIKPINILNDKPKDRWGELKAPLVPEMEFEYTDSHNTKTVRLIAMSELTLQDFNQIYGLNVTLLGLFDKNPTEEHDFGYWTNGSFIRHDGFNAYKKNISVDQKSLDWIHQAITSYHQTLRPKLSSAQQALFDILLFEETHERNDLLKETNPENTALTGVKAGLYMLPNDIQIAQGLYDNGNNCPETQKYRASLQEEDTIVPMFEQFKEELLSAYSEKRAFDIQPILDALNAPFQRG